MSGLIAIFIELVIGILLVICGYFIGVHRSKDDTVALCHQIKDELLYNLEKVKGYRESKEDDDFISGLEVALFIIDKNLGKFDEPKTEHKRRIK